MRRIARLSIRWRLALTSAGLTFAILLLFALVIGTFTVQRLGSDFDNDVRATAADLQQRIPVQQASGPLGAPFGGQVSLSREALVDVLLDVASTEDAAVRVVDARGALIAPAGAPNLGPPREGGVRDAGGYRVVSRGLYPAQPLYPVAFLQYGKRTDSLNATVARLKVFLAGGVLGGTVLALLAGLAVARRAMKPVADLTGAAREVVRTRDPAVRLPRPEADDEVAALAETLEQMLQGLDAARQETEATLTRERDFVADASHELRTPLTSVFANLELLEASLQGEDREAASSALRSSRRMRRLIGDLLLLARADAGRPAVSELVDLGAVLRAAAGEAMPVAEGHDLSVDAPEGVLVQGARDDLHRVALNLIENAIRHTPPGTSVRATVRRDGDHALLEVADNGPGVPPEMREKVFERFARGPRDRAPGGGTGLGLSIVRAVAETHGGSVTLADDGQGARFTVRLPAEAPVAPSTEAGGARVIAS